MGYTKSHLTLVFLLWASISCLSQSLLSEFSILGYDANELVSEDRMAEIFRAWRDQYKKEYKTEEETKIRFEIFKQNYQYVIEKNSKRRSWWSSFVDLNIFSDLTTQEFRDIYAMKNQNNTKSKEKVATMPPPLPPLPPSLDWRTRGVVTPIKYQGSCGSCWAFSSTGAIEGINAITTGELINLSEQELLDCVPDNNCSTGGYMYKAFDWVIKNGGISRNSDYPYTETQGVCQAKPENKAVTIDDFEQLPQYENALLAAVVNQPVSVMINGSSQDFYYYSSGIYDGECPNGAYETDHAVLIVGYGSEGGIDYWIVKNSWGTSWGMDGYAYIRRNTNLEYGVCAINAWASYPIKYFPYPRRDN